MARALNLVPFCFALVAMVAACGDDTRTPGNACNPACAAGLTCCGGACVATQTRADHCGMCGNVCAAGSTCAAGVCSGGSTMDGSVPMTDSSVPSMCTPTCSADERCCGATCFDRAAPAGQLDARGHESFLHCNGCGLGCDMARASRCGAPAGGGSAQCLCGNSPQCPVGQACAMTLAGTLGCVNTDFDPMNCGAVGNACRIDLGESCNMGVCGCGTGGPCAVGQACCGGTACIDVSADPMNCGGCGVVCGAGFVCGGGECRCGGVDGPVCNPGSGPSDLGNLCCDGACVPRDNANCTACGVGCAEDTCGWGAPLLGMGAEGPCCGMPGFPIPGLPFPEFLCGGGFGI